MTNHTTLQDRRAGQTKQIAGRLCLDFVNLVGGWQAAESRTKGANFVPRDERLNDYLDLVAWSLRAGLVDEAHAKKLANEARAHADEAGRTFKRAQRLRNAIHAIAKRIEDQQTPLQESLDVLSEEISRGWSKQRLTAGGRNLTWVASSNEALALDAPLAAVALSAEEFFTTADLSRLHSCPGDQCGWMFEDTTRNRSRRWCDMGDCGNKAKVREYRSRQAGQA